MLQQREPPSPDGPRYLMCQPSFFDVSYVINPWMKGNVHATSPEHAQGQWQRMHDLIARMSTVELVPSHPGLPDMPFTANAGLILEDTVVLSRFLHPERQDEESHFEDWFWDHAFSVRKLPPSIPFEGAGDALLDRKRSVLWMGHGHRSSIDSAGYLQRWLDIEVAPLRLIDERFYHLDTCFCPLEGGFVLYYRGEAVIALISAAVCAVREIRQSPDRAPPSVRHWPRQPPEAKTISDGARLAFSMRSVGT